MWKIFLIHLEIINRPKNKIIMLKSYLKQDNVLFQLYLNVKFPLLRLLHIVSDLKSTIVR